MFFGFVDLVVLKLRPQFLLLGDQFVHLRENVGILVHLASLPDYGGNRGH